jgi:hypothetical protein
MYKDTTIQLEQYKPEAMCIMYITKIDVVVLSIFNSLFFSFACALRFCLREDKDTIIQQYRLEVMCNKYVNVAP